MEKKIGSKEVKLQAKNAVDPTAQQSEKLSYEELNQACMDMSQQIQNQNKYIQHLRQENYQLGAVLSNKRLDYLFKVIETSSNLKQSGSICFPEDFIKNCLAEIQASLTAPEEGDKEPSKEE